MEIQPVPDHTSEPFRCLFEDGYGEEVPVHVLIETINKAKRDIDEINASAGRG